MTKQSKDSSVKRRKRSGSQSNAENGKQSKRQRAKSDLSDQPDEALLRVLTGQDSEPEKSVEKEPENDNEQPDSSVKIADADAPGSSRDPDNEEESDLKTNEGETKAEPLPWAAPLSEAHAKKVNVTVLLENANIETVKQSGRSGGTVLLNCDDHRHILKKANRPSNDARPDITHQCLLALMDSPLNKAGKLKVYVRTANNVLIEIHPQTRIPRTIKRFSGLMAELLEKFKIRGTQGSTPLLKVIRNPITSHLPVGTRKIVCTYNTDNIVDMRHHAGSMAALVRQRDGGKKGTLKEDEIEERGEPANVLYVVGAMAHGKVTEDWADDYICVSEYPLSAATVCSRITYAYECLFGIM